MPETDTVPAPTEEKSSSTFVRAAAVAGIGAALLAACGSDSTTPTTASTAAGTTSATTRTTGGASGDGAIITGAIELENQAIFAYTAAAGTGKLSNAVLAVGIKFRDQHQAHADALSKALEAAGGKAPAKKDTYDLKGPGGSAPDLSSEGGIVTFAAFLENVAAQAYLTAVGKLSTGELAQASANIMGVEARHAAILRSASGGKAIPAPFLDKQA